MIDHPLRFTRPLTPAEEDAEQTAFLDLGNRAPCGIERAAPGWFCRRIAGHAGPCAAVGTTPQTRDLAADAHSDVKRPHTRWNSFGGRIARILLAAALMAGAVYVLFMPLVTGQP